LTRCDRYSAGDRSRSTLASSNRPALHDVITAIFNRDARRQEIETMTRARFVANDELNTGTKNGVAFISFSNRRLMRHST
jgi:hypothetical protein